MSLSYRLHITLYKVVLTIESADEIPGNRSFRLRVVSPTLNSPTCKVDSPTCLMYVSGQFAYGSYVRVVPRCD